jgi:Outer membrane protein beta-barrel domain
MINTDRLKNNCHGVMKKSLRLSMAAVLLSFSSFAQVQYGIKAGVNFSNWKGEFMESLNNVVSLSNGFVQSQMKPGIYVGGFAELPLAQNFSIQPGLYYSQKGYTLQGDLSIEKLNFLSANARAQVQSHYIDIPVLLKAEPVKGLQIYAGPQISYLAKNNLHVNAGVLGFSLLNTNLDITDQFQRWDMAIVGGVGYQFENGLNIHAGYDHGLKRLDANENFRTFNRVYKLGVGFKF